ncbi:thioesterase family protein [Reinekea sp. G2M2-21]|uniref:acyl-CoA thioesterase n=1 Tax=Reinekea sp. G2M2-21 TaxID=2788942 RepID=UPI0018A9B8F2|nr:acyl-CoA thioesterase [Reinekea sp. G2M2-21]
MYQYTEHFKVRDYECDLQGIVNNAVYQNYLEHARHEFLLYRGVDFADLARQGVNLVVIRAELDYKRPLTSGDEFYVGVNFSMRDRVRFQFEQIIHRRDDDVVCVQAMITGTGMNERGRPSIPRDLAAKLMGQTASV